MLQARLLGQLDVRLDGQPIEIPSRPAQSLLAYLLLNPQKAHRRELLSGLFWPDVSESNARSNLRHALWRIRKALVVDYWDYLPANELTVTFRPRPGDWLDVTVLEEVARPGTPVEEWIRSLAVYEGELLPGFYDEWVILERGRLQAVFERKMQVLLERLAGERLWGQVLEQAEGWIARGYTPEPAYRALMLAHAGLGDLASVAAAYQRCVISLRDELGIDPSRQTHSYYELLSRGEPPSKLLQDQAGFAPPSPSPAPHGEAPAPGESPYKGLQFFDEVDAGLFFGRELLTAKLVRRLREEQHLTIVVGASGSGKSSLVRAGLIHALKTTDPLPDGTLPPPGSADWLVHVLRPTAHPLEALATSLTRHIESVTATATLIEDLRKDFRSLHLFTRKLFLDQGFPYHIQFTKEGERRRLLLIVDQFEELFTLCRDEAERKVFVDNLLTAVLPETGGLTMIVIVLRADFYHHCGRYAKLREALEEHQVYIGPMSAEEMRRAIEEPARRGGWEFEPGLVDLILRDVGAGEMRQPEPGGLPLLSHALLETWKRRRGNQLILASYAGAGGVHGAIARTAERVYQSLSEEEQIIAREIFLRLTELGKGIGETGLPLPDTRRRAALTELIPDDERAPLVKSVLQTLTDARLIIISGDASEVAHEALIREWPSLREWLAEDREGLHLHRHLTEASQEWEKLNREPGALYRGSRLVQARKWVDAHPEKLNTLEFTFIQESIDAAKREVAEREAQQRREIKVSIQLAEAERRQAEAQAKVTRQQRRWTLYLAGTLILVAFLVFGGVQWIQRADQEARLAASNELVTTAFDYLETDPELSLLLAIEAVEIAETLEVEDFLRRAIRASRLRVVLSGHSQIVETLFFNSDGTRLVSVDVYGAVKVWNTASGKELLSLPSKTVWINEVTVSPDGSHLATVLFDGNVSIQDISQVPDLIGSPGENRSMHSNRTLAFSPNGVYLAKPESDGTIHIFDTNTGQAVFILDGHDGSVNGLAWSIDGTYLASAGVDETVRIWELTLPSNLPIERGQEILQIPIQGVQTLAFSPDGSRLVTGQRNGDAKIWNPASGEEVFRLASHRSRVNAVAFSPGGERVATGSQDQRTILWEVSTGEVEFFLPGHSGAISSLAFSPDGNSLATASGDKTIQLWDISPSGNGEVLSRSFPGLFPTAGFTLKGAPLVVTSQGDAVKVLNATSSEALLSFDGEGGEPPQVVLSPDGKWLIEFYNTGTMVRVWDIQAKNSFTIEIPGELDIAPVFSLDGDRMLTDSGSEKTVWEIPSWKVQSHFSVQMDAPLSNAINSDGKRMASVLANAGVLTSSGWIIDTSSGEVINKVAAEGRMRRVAFNPDGDRLAIGDFLGGVMVRDAASGESLINFKGHLGQINSLAFSPDGKRLASASEDATVKVWDLVAGEEQFTLPGHSDPILIVTFSFDGRLLASIDSGGTLRIYLMRIEDLITLAKSRVFRALTNEECQRFLRLEQCPIDR